MRADSEINQLLIGKALSDVVDGGILNPHGVQIDIPFWVFKRLKKLRLLEHNPEAGKARICGSVFGVLAARMCSPI